MPAPRSWQSNAKSCWLKKELQFDAALFCYQGFGAPGFGIFGGGGRRVGGLSINGISGDTSGELFLRFGNVICLAIISDMVGHTATLNAPNIFNESAVTPPRRTPSGGVFDSKTSALEMLRYVNECGITSFNDNPGKKGL